MEKRIVVWGAGGHAKVVAQSLLRLGWTLHGFIDDVDAGRAGSAFCGACVLGGREALAPARAAGVAALALAFGNNAVRLTLAAEFTVLGWHFPAIVDPNACVADDVVPGAGSYVAAGVVIQPGARIGAQAIVNTGAIVDHDCEVGAGVHVCPRACLAGQVHVGRGTWVGAGALVRDRVRLGEAVFVGIGALVIADVPDGWLVHGHPARLIHKVSP